MRELLTLCESLQKGTCSFQPLLAANQEALQLAVNEQDRNGENPWGKQKHRNDAGMPRKRTVCNSTDAHPPSHSSLGNDLDDSGDSEIDATSNGDTSHRNEGEWPCPIIQKCSHKMAHQAVVCFHMSASSRSLMRMKVA